jgi:hypothetical protein
MPGSKTTDLRKSCIGIQGEMETSVNVGGPDTHVREGKHEVPVHADVGDDFKTTLVNGDARGGI